MEWWLAALLIFGGFAILLMIGMPVAFSFLFVNLAGAVFFWGGMAGLHQLIYSISSSVTRFALAPVVLFMLMGEILYRSGLVYPVLDFFDKSLGRLPGRLGLVTVATSTLFATLSGSQMANAAMLSSTIAPEMRKIGYSKSMTLGPILGAGGLAIMIPPSGLAVLLGAIAGISISGILIGGAIPGLVMASLYASYILLRCWQNPSLAPSYTIAHVPLSEKTRLFARHVLPLGSVVFLVTGLILLGVATPTEAAALGCLGSLILAASYKKLTLGIVNEAGRSALRTAVMVLMIFTGSKAFGQILAYSGATHGMIELVTGLTISPFYVLVVMLVILIVLGMFIDQMSILMVSMPIYMPIVHLFGFDPIWFGVMVLLTTEMGSASPPFGMMLFVVKGASPPDVTMGDIYRATLPYIGCDIITMTLILFVPAVATWLPSLI